MAEIQLFKTRITHACRLIRSSESDLKLLDNPFTFPTEKEECAVYIREKTAQLNHLTTTITKAKQLHDTYVDKAIETISSRSEQKDREKLMLELNNHMELESNSLEIAIIQWLSKIEFRKEELAQQASFIAEAASIANQAGSSQHNCHSGGDTLNTLYERTIRVRRPLLEVPTFSGDYREFNTFWSVFESLIHNETDLSDQEKFLFLKQALKGKAAASISSIPVIGDKYNVALNILKKQYDRSSSIADILINEIEHLPRAQENSRSCRNTFNSISSRIVHLEQTGVPMNADRVWRRLILSKFTENICSRVIKKENQSGTGFEVKDILDAVDEIITLQETTELTTKTLFGSQSAQAMQNNARGHNGGRNQMKQFPSHRLRHTCLFGESHSPQQCARFPAPETRRMEAKRQGVCWKCFDKTHGSRFCTAMGPCPKCKGDHHGSLCITSSSGLESMILPNRRQNPPPNSTQHGAARMPLPSQTNRFRRPTPRNNNNSRETNRVQTLHAAPARNFTTDSERPVSGQCVLQMASTLIFNEGSGDYQPITILLDSGAQKSFIKAEMRNRLRLPTIGSTSFTITGMGELQETFKSDEVKVTLKGLRSSRKLQRLSVFTKEKLTTTTKAALLSGADKSFIKRKKIMVAQQTLRPSEVSPDLLIGQDLLNQVIEHHNPVIKLPSGLVLTPTIFGCTISGTGSIPNPMKQVRDVQCGSLIVATPLISSKDYSKMDKNISGAEAPLANIRDPAPFRRSAAKARLEWVSKIPPEGTPRKMKGPIGQPKTTLRTPLVSQDDKGVFSNKDASDTFYALLDSVNDIKRKLNRMEDRLRRLDERVHTLDLRTLQVTQTEVPQKGTPQCPTIPTTRCCKFCCMTGHQATNCQFRSAILQESTGRIAQRPTNRPIPLEIHSSSHDQNDESSTYRARGTTPRKSSSTSRKKADAPMRCQPPRAAEN
ncbi:hypothetical protein V3C99_015391 [Haemonchus contortus]|uniref:Peptidase A2 domain-containing protein n=1 Tax=Haemonchus contortus TaxID=6289 RepID=A0A7I5ECM4_HAECO